MGIEGNLEDDQMDNNHYSCTGSYTWESIFRFYDCEQGQDENEEVCDAGWDGVGIKPWLFC